jgi:hypothetical protein
MAVTAGLSADWGSECRKLVSTFDEEWHDPAKTQAQVQSWIARTRTLFHDGHILAEAAEGQTLSRVATKALQNAPPVVYGNREKHFWHVGAKQEAVEVMAGMRAIWQLASERLQAEFDDQGLPQDSSSVTFFTSKFMMYCMHAAVSSYHLAWHVLG